MSLQTTDDNSGVFTFWIACHATNCNWSLHCSYFCRVGVVWLETLFLTLLLRSLVIHWAGLRLSMHRCRMLNFIISQSLHSMVGWQAKLRSLLYLSNHVLNIKSLHLHLCPKHYPILASFSTQHGVNLNGIAFLSYVGSTNGCLNPEVQNLAQTTSNDLTSTFRRNKQGIALMKWQTAKNVSGTEVFL